MNIIKVTKNAHKILSQINKNYNKEFISFGIKNGGCSGFQYVIEPCNDKPNKLDEVVKIDNIEIHVCNNSLMHLLGTNIDWTEDIMGQGFTFQNPMAQSKCGCGTSFSSKAFN